MNKRVVPRDPGDPPRLSLQRKHRRFTHIAGADKHDAVTDHDHRTTGRALRRVGQRRHHADQPAATAPCRQRDANPLPETISTDGTFGGPVTTDTEIHLIPAGNAFEPVSAIVVRTTGTPGAVSTPARLLSGIGASLHTLSADAVTAFGRDVLPRLSQLDQSRTTITVGTFYDLTIVIVDDSTLTYIYTTIGVAPAADLP